MVDIEEISRMIKLTGDDFVDISWTPAERLYCAGRPERFATRWAAKEATMKALGQGMGQISPLDIEVTATDGDRPMLAIHGNAQQQALQLGIDTWSVSLTHEDRWALAFVVGLGIAR